MRDQDPRESRRRACPFCSKPIMALATLCGHCWSKVEPVSLECVESETFPDYAGQSGMGGGESEEYRNAPRRSCPRCGKTIMAAATLCGHCWNHVRPVR
jgi:predicted amidophosphoribosyltransferase